MGIIRARRAGSAARRTRHGGSDLPVPVPVPPIVEWINQLTSAERSCCCAARPVVAVVLARPRRFNLPTAVLLCGHHYRANRHVLTTQGACVYNRSGQLISGQMWRAA